MAILPKTSRSIPRPQDVLIQKISPLSFSVVNEITNQEYQPASDSYPVYVQ